MKQFVKYFVCKYYVNKMSNIKKRNIVFVYGRVFFIYFYVIKCILPIGADSLAYHVAHWYWNPDRASLPGHWKRG